MEKNEFIAKFKDELRKLLPAAAWDHGYIDEIALTYWDDLDHRAEGPEECAGAETSEWGDE